MKFRISKESEISAHDQLREQIIFAVGTGDLATGQEMPSVRSLSRQLNLSLNTISKVYSELARAGWLFERAGAHHTVLTGQARDIRADPETDFDDLIDGMIRVAQDRGYSLQQLTKRLRQRLLQEPPDHLLILEPDKGMGEIMQKEISEIIGYAPKCCSFASLEKNPAVRIGAVLIAPTYMSEKLGRLAADRDRFVSVGFSPFDTIVAALSTLPESSMLGWMSVSAAGLKTLSGLAAPIIGDRHTSHFFLVEQADQSGGMQHHIRRYTTDEYEPRNILKPAAPPKRAKPPEAHQNLQGASAEQITVADLRCMDLLFCDSVTSALIEHPGRVHYRLLSVTSLERIRARATTLPRP